MEYTLNVGETVLIKRQFLGQSHHVTYAGTPNPATFSLVVFWRHGAAAAAYNLFYPIQQRELHLHGASLIVEEVSPVALRFRFEADKSSPSARL